jgi:hypothetical protein
MRKRLIPLSKPLAPASYATSIRTLRLTSLVLAAPLLSFAQAFLSPEGEGSVSILYQYSIDRLHAYEAGVTKDTGHMYWNTVVLDADYSITDRLAVRASLPFIAGKYVGTHPHQVVRGDPSTTVALDDGAYHGTVTDFRLDVRYSLTKGALKVVPDFQATIPAHPYPVFLHALYGADAREYRMGVSVARRLNPILPKMFFQGRYAFGIGQEFVKVSPKVSYGEAQLGYLLARRLIVQGSAAGLYTHNGVDWPAATYPNNLTEDQWLNHVRVSKARQLDAGGSIAYEFNRSTQFVLSLGHTFLGENTHLRYIVATVGFVRAFSTSRSEERASQSAVLPDGTKATTCTCAKSK